MKKLLAYVVMWAILGLLCTAFTYDRDPFWIQYLQGCASVAACYVMIKAMFWAIGYLYPDDHK